MQFIKGRKNLITVGRGKYKTAYTLAGCEVLYLDAENEVLEALHSLNKNKDINEKHSMEYALTMHAVKINQSAEVTAQLKCAGINTPQTYGSFIVNNNTPIIVVEKINAPQLFAINDTAIEVIANKLHKEKYLSALEKSQFAFQYDSNVQQQLINCNQKHFDKLVCDIVTLRDKFDIRHDDLHGGNILFDGNEFTIIDFSTSKSYDEISDFNIAESVVEAMLTYYNDSAMVNLTSDKLLKEVVRANSKKHMQNNLPILNKVLVAFKNNNLKLSERQCLDLLGNTFAYLSDDDYDVFSDNINQTFNIEQCLEKK